MTRRLLMYRRNDACLQYEARCKHCLQQVASVTDEALRTCPEPGLLTPVVHDCPCTCASDPYTCPVGQALASAITERKGNQ